MTRTATLAGLAVVIALAFGGAAGAAPAYACTIDDPTDCPTYTVVHHNTLTVSTTRGTISSDPSGISCPGTCSHDYSYEDFCTDLPGRDECDSGIPVDVTLTASGGGSGFGPHWSGCDSSAGSQCGITMEGDRSVGVTWTDDADPTVGLTSPPSRVGPSSVFTATASDNAGVSKVDFYVDDVLKASDTSAPYQFSPDLSPYADGSAHSLKAISEDTSGRRSSAASAGFTVDKSTGLTGVTSPPAYTQTAPSIAFTAPADATSVVCRTKFGGTVTGTTPACTSPYAPQGIGTDGPYTVELAVTDDVGNSATVTKSFTLDRGAPNLTVSGPASGAIVPGPFTPVVSASDGFSDVSFACKVDAGAFGSCASLAPSDGAHTLTVRASDEAGNTTDVQRSFTYDSHAPAAAITGGPGEGTVVYTRSTAFTFTTSDLTAVTRSCKLDGGAFGACTSATGHSLSGLGLGIHTFTLRAVDAAGHTTTVARHFTVADKPVDPGGGTGGTGGTGGSTDQGGGTSGPTVKQATVTTFWKLFGKRTQVATLTLDHTPAGARVTVACKGKGCAFKKAKLTSTGKRIKLAKRFKKRKLAAKTVITITVADDTGSKRFRYTLRAGKFPKKSIT